MKMIRIAEVSSVRRVIWDWESLRLWGLALMTRIAEVSSTRRVMTRIAEVSSDRRVMTRIAEASSGRRVIWDWESLRLWVSGGYL